MLTGKFFLKLVCARSAAKIIGLPPNIFRHGYSPWNKHQADGILNHLILSRGKTFWLTLAFESPESPPKEEIQYDKQPENEDNSIHSGARFLMPQSYGTGSLLSRTPFSGLVDSYRMLIRTFDSNGLAGNERTGHFPGGASTSDGYVSISHPW